MQALCPHRPPCPGCPRLGEPGLHPETAGALTRLATDLGASLRPVEEGAPWAFRHRARLAVRGRPGSPKIGIFQEGSHRIADIPRCLIQHPRINEAVAAVKRAIAATDTWPYVERAHRGALRYVQAVVERESARVQLVLVGNAETPEPLGALAAHLRDDLDSRLHSLWWNGNPARTNAILGPHWARLCGAEAVHERIGGASVFFPPAAFGQSHLDLADRIVGAVHEQVPAGAVVAELYAGCGAIGLGLLAHAREVRFNELNAHALRGLELGLAAQPPTARARARIAGGPAAAALELLDGADVVIVDPPRRGLDAELRDRLVARPPARLLYVSCDVGSLARDLATLTAGSALRARELRPYALFPYTEHVETLAVLER